MNKKLEIAKQLYKQKNNLKRLVIKPYILKGLNEPSKVAYLVNNQKKFLTKIGNKYEFLEK
jgi:hypothetical protein